MARTGHRRRKRKFNGNQHPQKSAKSAKYDIENPVSGEDSNSTIEESKQSVSGRKIKAKLEVKEDKEAKPTSSSLTGYRLMDMEILADIFRLMCCNNCGLCRLLRWVQPIDGHALQGHVITNLTLFLEPDLHVGSDCRNRCVMESRCVSINMGPPIKDKVICQLSDSDHIRHPEDLKPREGFVYRNTVNSCSSNPCLHNATCMNGFTNNGFLCNCQTGYTGERCEKDVDECTTGTHSCHVNATCNNTKGSYDCICKTELNCTFKAVFTNLGKTGIKGPTSLGSHYSGQDHDGQVTLSSGIQQWTVPYTGDYRIEAIGAAGGYGKNSSNGQYRGRGARMIGTFTLFKYEIIQILVGQEGGITSVYYGSGGGGGTFVVRGSNMPLIIAGGGGGIHSVQSRHAGCDASTSTTGNPGYKSWSGGSNGHGAQIADDGVSGGGGGGFYSSGRSGNNFGGTKGKGGEGGNGFLQGGVGGRGYFKNNVGGFGGGGGSGSGGGGGGYSGGSSGDHERDSCGGGGGSYNAGKNQQNDCCYKTAGHGHVTIKLL